MGATQASRPVQNPASSPATSGDGQGEAQRPRKRLVSKWAVVLLAVLGLVGVTLQTFRSQPKVLWEIRLQGIDSHDKMPLVGKDGTLYVMTKEGFGEDQAVRLHLINQAGEVIEEMQLDHETKEIALADDGTLYLVESEALVAVDANGRAKWTWKHDNFRVNDHYYEYVSPGGNVVFGQDGTAYFAASGMGAKAGQEWFDMRVYALDSDGSVKWSYIEPTQSIYLPVAGTVGVDGKVFFEFLHGGPGDEPDQIVALSETGKRMWTSEAGSLFPPPYAAKNGTLYLGGVRVVRAYDSDRSLKWEKDGIGFTQEQLVQDDGTVYVTDEDALYAVDPNGQTLWTYAMGEKEHASSDGGYLLLGTVGGDGVLYLARGQMDVNESILFALSSDGKRKWQLKIHGEPHTPVEADGVIYLPTTRHHEDGNEYTGIYAIKE